MKLAMQSDRRKTPELFDFEPMTADEIRSMQYGARPYVILNSGRVGIVKINGVIKTWKTRPNEFEVPIKYGMYECTRFSADEALRRFVKRVN